MNGMRHPIHELSLESLDLVGVVLLPLLLLQLLLMLGEGSGALLEQDCIQVLLCDGGCSHLSLLVLELHLLLMLELHLVCLNCLRLPGGLLSS